MKVITGRNVEELYALGTEYLLHDGESSRSRNGNVLVSPVPVTSVYQRPTERVLMDASRDANPFFHLYESLWMLSGLRSSRPLDFFVKDFGSRFAEANWDIHGAYGHRWRTAFGFDQLYVIVQKLRKDFADRQCVLQMWDCTWEHHAHTSRVTGESISYGMDDLSGNWKDRPCNTHVYFRVRPVKMTHETRGVVDMETHRYVLDMTVCCRSNDIVWGAYGANAVHFSVLQEYVAGRVGVGVGTMYQVSNNFHGYVDVMARMKTPKIAPSWYETNNYTPGQIGTDWDCWDDDLKRFVGWSVVLSEALTSKEKSFREVLSSALHDYQFQFVNDWFMDTPVPMVLAYGYHRCGDREKAIESAHHIKSSDWRAACVAWLERRKK